MVVCAMAAILSKWVDQKGNSTNTTKHEVCAYFFARIGSPFLNDLMSMTSATPFTKED